MDKKIIDWRVICVGLFCLTAVELYVISKGINGWALSIFFAIVGTAIGLVIPFDKIIRR